MPMGNLSMRSMIREAIACSFGIILTLVILAVTAIAQTVSAETETFDIDIKSQSISSALGLFAKRTNTQFAYDHRLTHGLRSTDVKGQFTREEAVAQLLRGSGLNYRFTAPNIVALRSVSSDAFAQANALPTIDVSGTQSNDSDANTVVAKRSSAGTKTNTPLLETPQAISVVTRQQMEQQQPQTVNEIFRYTAGVVPEPFGTAARYTDQYLIVRGFRPEIYLDGLKLPPFSSTDPYLLERAELIHGPASVLYGQTSPGGLVNLVSKRPTDKTINEVNIGYGTFGKMQGSFDIGGRADKDGKVLYRLTGIGYTDDTQVDFTKSQRVAIAPALTFRPDASTSLTILANYIKDPNLGIYSGLPAIGTVLPNRNGQIPTSFYPGDPNFDTWKREQGSIGYLFEHSDSIFTVRQNVRYSENKLEERHLYPFALSANQEVLSRYGFLDLIKRQTFQADNHLQVDIATGPLQHKIIVGVDYLKLKLDENFGTNFGEPSIKIFNPFYGQNTVTPILAGNPITKSDQLGLYAQDQIKLNQTSFLIGVRKDYAGTDSVDSIAKTTTTQNDQALTWRAGVVHVFDNGLAPYASYSTSFQPQVGGGISNTGAPFVPTSGEQYEAGIKYQPVGMDSFVTVAVFDLKQQNVLTPDPTNPNFRVQTGEISSKGVEVEAHANLTPNLSLIGAYTHLNNVVTKANSPAVPINNTLGKVPVGVPADMASLWLNYAFKEGPMRGLSVSGGIRYIGETFGAANNIWGTAAPGFEAAASIVPDFTLYDAAIRYDIDEHWRVSVNATNLFDKVYVSSCTSGTNCYYGSRRTILANLRYAW
jgi:iron complex outermembrane receptor protein